MSDLINKIFDQRADFLVLGLTGQTGSGCTTVSQILSKDSFIGNNFALPVNSSYQDNSNGKYEICYKYLKEN